MTKKPFAAALMIVLGLSLAVAAGRYSRPSGDILTPAYEELAEGMHLPENSVPLSVGPGAAGPDGVTGAVVKENPSIIKVINLVNEERAKAGLPPLEEAADVSVAAGVRAQELTSSFSHTRPDGSAYKTALVQNGVTFRISGENVAYGYSSPEAVMAAWMNSEGHRQNILNEKYTTIGVGNYTKGGQEYWAQLFTNK